MLSESIDHFPSHLWCFDDQFIHSGCIFSGVGLCDSSKTDESIGVAFQHELLERAHLLHVALLCGPKDPLSQVTNSPIGFLPVDGLPIGLFLGSVC